MWNAPVQAVISNIVSLKIVIDMSMSYIFQWFLKKSWIQYVRVYFFPSPAGGVLNYDFAVPSRNKYCVTEILSLPVITSRPCSLIQELHMFHRLIWPGLFNTIFIPWISGDWAEFWVIKTLTILCPCESNCIQIKREKSWAVDLVEFPRLL